MFALFVFATAGDVPSQSFMSVVLPIAMVVGLLSGIFGRRR